jgi:hypothetical protein
LAVVVMALSWGFSNFGASQNAFKRFLATW